MATCYTVVFFEFSGRVRFVICGVKASMGMLGEAELRLSVPMGCWALGGSWPDVYSLLDPSFFILRCSSIQVFQYILNILHDSHEI